MVRDDEIDVGLWKDVSTSDLVVPLDTHMANVSRWTGLTKMKSHGWAMAESVTRALKKFDREDPVKYDFALTRATILNGCRPASAACGRCELKEICTASSVQTLRRGRDGTP
jgi:endonuclease III